MQTNENSLIFECVFCRDCSSAHSGHSSVQLVDLTFSDPGQYLNGFPEVYDWNTHRPVLVDVTEEVPQAKLALIKVILQKGNSANVVRDPQT